MIRYSNRFKAGTRRNKHWARTNGPDRHYSISSDDLQTCANLIARAGVDLKTVQKATGRTPDINFGLKPNHATRTINVDWKAINDARKAKEMIAKAIELESERRRKEDEEADTSTMEGAKEYMEKVVQRKATTIEPGHI